MRREFVTGCTVRRYEQLETYPETIEQELRPAVCEHRQTDRLKENYNIDNHLGLQSTCSNNKYPKTNVNKSNSSAYMSYLKCIVKQGALAHIFLFHLGKRQSLPHRYGQPCLVPNCISLCKE